MKDFYIALIVLAILVALFSFQQQPEANEPSSGTQRAGDAGEALQSGEDFKQIEDVPITSPQTGDSKKGGVLWHIIFQ